MPGSTYWNLGFGRNPGEADHDAEGLDNMRHLGQAIAWLGAALEGRREAYPGAPAGPKD